MNTKNSHLSVANQSISLLPFFPRYAFAAEKCLHPKKPLNTLKGEGCGASRIKCLDALINFALVCAGLPQSIKTTFPSGLALTALIIASVKVSQPCPA